MAFCSFTIIVEIINRKTSTTTVLFRRFCKKYSNLSPFSIEKESGIVLKNNEGVELSPQSVIELS